MFEFHYLHSEYAELHVPSPFGLDELMMVYLFAVIYHPLIAFFVLQKFLIIKCYLVNQIIVVVVLTL